MCCFGGLTSCGGSGCGYCSECVNTAACNPVLCSSCITGSLCGIVCTPVCTPTPGSGTDICTNTATSCCIAPVCCLPYAGTDASGNDIYQNPDGSLRYSDGSPATRADIAYNCGACHGTPCSPGTCGTSCQPPKAGSSNRSSSGGPSGGGSGGGTAKPSGGKSNPQCSQMSKLSQAMSRLGASFTSLLAGGKRTNAKNILPGQAIQKNALGLSPNAFLLVILIVGGLLLFMAFGHKPVAD
jgi:hypothetical protein